MNRISPRSVPARRIPGLISRENTAINDNRIFTESLKNILCKFEKIQNIPQYQKTKNIISRQWIQHIDKKSETRVAIIIMMYNEKDDGSIGYSL